MPIDFTYTTDNIVSSDDSWGYVQFVEGDVDVTLDGEFTIEELKEIIAKMESYLK